MNVDDLISVVIPAYNHEQYVQEAIQSVIDQTYFNIELIIINDGSSDKTWEKIKEMESICNTRFHRVIFENQENQGTCITLNRLITLAEGQYIQIVASDDKLMSNSAQILYDFLSISPDFSLAVGKNIFIDDKSQLCFWDADWNIVYNKSEAHYLDLTDALSYKINLNSEKFGAYQYLLEGNHIPNGYLIRKDIFNKVGFFTKEAPLEDYWLMLQISKHSKLKYIDEITFCYRWHNSNTAKQREKMKKMEHQTLSYEMDMIHRENDYRSISLLKKTFPDKVYFLIPYFMKFYKEKTPVMKRSILKILKWNIIIHKK